MCGFARPDLSEAAIAACKRLLDSACPRFDRGLGNLTGSERHTFLRARPAMAGRDGAAGADGASTSSDGASTSSSPPRKHPWRWHPSRARHHESDSHPTWLRRRRHLFIVSDAGKPLWSRYGGEDSLAGFTAALSAIVAFVGDDGDALRSVGWLGSTADARGADGRRPRRPRELTVLRRGPIVLAAMTSTGESPAALRRQLHLLHAQLIALLTRAVERALTRSSKFDARGRLLGGGTDALLGTLSHHMTWDPGCWMRAWAPLPLPPQWREKCARALRDGLVRAMGGVGAGALLGVLLTDRHVAAVANADHRAGKSATGRSSSSSSSSYSSPGGGDRGARGTAGDGARGRGRYYAGIDPDDVITLCNTVRSGASFRANEESFAPVCLPNYDADAFAFAYVAYLRASSGDVGGRGEDEPGGRGIDSRDNPGGRGDDGKADRSPSSNERGHEVCLVLVSTSRDAFPAAAAARARIEETLRREGLLDRIAARVREPPRGSRGGSRYPHVGDSVPGSITIPRDVPPAAGGGGAAGTPLLHFVYLRPFLGQYVAPDWSPPLHGRREQKRLLRTYQRAFHSMRRWWPSEREWDDDAFAARGGASSSSRGGESGDAAEAGGSPLAAFFGGLGISSLPGGVFGASSGEDGGSDAGGSDDDVRDRRVHYEVCDDHVLLGCVGSDFELYVALDPLTRRSAAVAVCNRLCAWLRAEEAGLFAVC